MEGVMDVIPRLLWAVGALGVVVALLKDTKRDPNDWLVIALVIGCVITGIIVFKQQSYAVHLWAGIAMLVLGALPNLKSMVNAVADGLHTLFSRVITID